MEELVLLGGFGAFVVFGFFVMAKLDHFLEQVRNRNGVQAPRLNVATPSLSAVPSVSNILKELHRQYPDMRYSLSFDVSDADAAIVSTEAENGIPAPWAQVTCRWTWRP